MSSKKKQVRKIRTSAPPPPSPTPIKKQTESNGFLGTLIQGFSFGTGSSIAHHGINSLFSNKSTPEKENTQSHTENKSNQLTGSTDCGDLLVQYKDCLDTNWNQEDCKEAYTKLQNCINKTI